MLRSATRTLERAQRLALSGRWEDMHALLARAVRRFPHDSELAYLFGMAKMQCDPQHAPPQLAEAVVLNENDAWLVVRVAGLMVELDEFEAVRVYADHVETLESPDPNVLDELVNVRGLLALHDGDAAEAERLLLEAVNLDPANATYLESLLEFLVRAGREQEAERLFDDRSNGLRGSEFADRWRRRRLDKSE